MEMAESLLKNVRDGDIDAEKLTRWLKGAKDVNFECCREEFAWVFFNYLHKEAESEVCAKPPQARRLNGKVEKSFSCPQVATPVRNVMLNSSHSSPVSPLYQPRNNGTVPRHSAKKSPITIGDFMVNGVDKPSKKKTNSKCKRRINPTTVGEESQAALRTNSYNFGQEEEEEVAFSRDRLVEEKKVLQRQANGSPPELVKAVAVKVCGRKKSLSPPPRSATNLASLDRHVTIVTALMDMSYANVCRELQFLVNLLVQKDCNSSSPIFGSPWNIAYFASKCLERQLPVLRHCDKTTLKLLSQHPSINQFTPAFAKGLSAAANLKPERTVDALSTTENVCFNSDTDNKTNFLSDQSFHAFKKQRDLFYDILRLWKMQHLTPNFSYEQSFAGKIRALINLHPDPVNFVHFARLFKSQLLCDCKGQGVKGAPVNLQIDADKLNRLNNRLVTKKTSSNGSEAPTFVQYEEFYRDFIIVANSPVFNKHLCDAIMTEVMELNETIFTEGVEENGSAVDPVSKETYRACLKSLRVLAKFLGFVEALPYSGPSTMNYPESVVASLIKVRQQVVPSFDVRRILEESMERGSLVVCVPWLTKYLAMLDRVTLRLPYYTPLWFLLFDIYRHFDSGCKSNDYLIKFCLGWLFEQPQFPDTVYLAYCKQADTAERPEKAQRNLRHLGGKAWSLDERNVVDQNALYLCCPVLEEIKNLLTTSSATSQCRPPPVRHITPVTEVQPREKKIEEQLREAFFSSQPASVRKTMDFITERVASTCVKHTCYDLVPNCKNEQLEHVLVKKQEQLVFEEKKFAKLIPKLLRELREMLTIKISKMMDVRIAKAVGAMMPVDTLPETMIVCIDMIKKGVVDRYNGWVNTHINEHTYKDFSYNLYKKMNVDEKQSRPIFALPLAGGEGTCHDEEASSGVCLLNKIRDTCSDVIEGVVELTESDVMDLLDETHAGLTRRNDVNECITDSICTLLLDLSILLMSFDATLMTDAVKSRIIDISKLWYKNADELHRNILCPRNVLILNRSPAPEVAWRAFAAFCSKLLKDGAMTCATFEAQCLGLYKHDWDEKSLEQFTDFLKRFVLLYRKTGGSHGEFSFLLEFLSDYCEDLHNNYF